MAAKFSASFGTMLQINSTSTCKKDTFTSFNMGIYLIDIKSLISTFRSIKADNSKYNTLNDYSITFDHRS